MFSAERAANNSNGRWLVESLICNGIFFSICMDDFTCIHREIYHSRLVHNSWYIVYCPQTNWLNFDNKNILPLLWEYNDHLPQTALLILFNKNGRQYGAANSMLHVGNTDLNPLSPGNYPRFLKLWYNCSNNDLHHVGAKRNLTPLTNPKQMINTYTNQISSQDDRWSTSCKCNGCKCVSTSVRTLN